MKKSIISLTIVSFICCILASCNKQDEQLPLDKRFYNAQMNAKYTLSRTPYGKGLSKELKKHTPASLKHEKGLLYYVVNFQRPSGGQQFFIGWLADKSDVCGVECFSKVAGKSEIFIFSKEAKHFIKEAQNKVAVSCAIVVKNWKDKSLVAPVFKNMDCQARLIGSNLKPLGKWVPVVYYTKEEHEKIVNELHKISGQEDYKKQGRTYIRKQR